MYLVLALSIHITKVLSILVPVGFVCDCVIKINIGPDMGLHSIGCIILGNVSPLILMESIGALRIDIISPLFPSSVHFGVGDSGFLCIENHHFSNYGS